MGGHGNRFGPSMCHRRYKCLYGERVLIFFSPNIAQESKDEIFATLGLMQDSRHTRYLGLPSFIEKVGVFYPKREDWAKAS